MLELRCSGMIRITLDLQKGEPWITVNPNYKEINVKQAIQDEGSIFYYYKKLIELRKNNEIVVYGSYDLILENNPSIFAYVRTYGDENYLLLQTLLRMKVYLKCLRILVIVNQNYSYTITM